MRFIEEYETEYSSSPVKILGADYMGHFELKIKFSNGVTKTVDFKNFLSQSLHPSIRKYNDEKLFRQFEIVQGNLNWNDYDLIFPISDLQSGKI